MTKNWPWWIVLLANLLVIAGLWGVATIGRFAGWQLCLGFVTGGMLQYAMFRWHYGWWPDFNMDGEDKSNSLLPRIDLDNQERKINADSIMFSLVFVVLIGAGVYLVL